MNAELCEERVFWIFLLCQMPNGYVHSATTRSDRIRYEKTVPLTRCNLPASPFLLWFLVCDRSTLVKKRTMCLWMTEGGI